MDAQKGLTRAPDLSGKGDLYSGLHILDEYVQDTYGDEIIDEDGGKHSTDSATANLAAFREQTRLNTPTVRLILWVRLLEKLTKQPANLWKRH